MSVRELIVLGTSSQVPTRYRNHNGYLLRWDEEGILFDPGEGTQRQMTLAEVSATSINKVCITHFHGDHCLGFAGIAQRFSLDRTPHTVDVYFPASGVAYYERLKKASIYRVMATMEAHPIEVEGVIHHGKNFDLLARPLQHGVDTWGYRLQEHDDRTMLPEKLAAAGVVGPAIGRLKREGVVPVGERTVHLDDVSIHKRGQSVAFVMDTRLCPGAFELAEGVDLLICESTYLSSESKDAYDHGHLTAKQAAHIAKEAGAKMLVLTHFSQRYPSTAPFVAEAKTIFPEVVAARDLQRIPVPKRSAA